MDLAQIIPNPDDLLRLEPAELPAEDVMASMRRKAFYSEKGEMHSARRGAGKASRDQLAQGGNEARVGKRR